MKNHFSWIRFRIGGGGFPEIPARILYQSTGIWWFWWLLNCDTFSVNGMGGNGGVGGGGSGGGCGGRGWSRRRERGSPFNLIELAVVGPYVKGAITPVIVVTRHICALIRVELPPFKWNLHSSSSSCSSSPFHPLVRNENKVPQRIAENPCHPTCLLWNCFYSSHSMMDPLEKDHPTGILGKGSWRGVQAVHLPFSRILSRILARMLLCGGEGKDGAVGGGGGGAGEGEKGISPPPLSPPPAVCSPLHPPISTRLTIFMCLTPSRLFHLD